MEGTLGNTLRMGNWAHTLNLNFQSGYQDFPAEVYELDANWAIVAADTVRLKIKSYYTVDWQTAFSFNKALTLTVGVKNLFDKDPPLSLRVRRCPHAGLRLPLLQPAGTHLAGEAQPVVLSPGKALDLFHARWSRAGGHFVNLRRFRTGDPRT